MVELLDILGALCPEVLGQGLLLHPVYETGEEVSTHARVISQSLQLLHVAFFGADALTDRTLGEAALLVVVLALELLDLLLEHLYYRAALHI